MRRTERRAAPAHAASQDRVGEAGAGSGSGSVSVSGSGSGSGMADMPAPRRKPVVISLRERALRILVRREYSRLELRRRLLEHAASEKELDALLDALEQKKQLSDQRYAESRARVLGRKYSSARIGQELRRQGVGDEDMARAMQDARAADLQRARTIWQRKFGARASFGLTEDADADAANNLAANNPAADNAAERARQIRFLQSRGFSFDIIRQVIAGSADFDAEANANADGDAQ
jgi:regulatory protein